MCPRVNPMPGLHLSHHETNDSFDHSKLRIAPLKIIINHQVAGWAPISITGRIIPGRTTFSQRGPMKRNRQNVSPLTGIKYERKLDLAIQKTHSKCIETIPFLQSKVRLGTKSEIGIIYRLAFHWCLLFSSERLSHYLRNLFHCFAAQLACGFLHGK